MPSPVQSNCDAHNTIANGQYGAIWSIGQTQKVCVRIVLPPLKRLATVFRRICFPEAARNWRRTSNTTSPCRLLHIPVVLNDFHSRETTLDKDSDDENELYVSAPVPKSSEMINIMKNNPGGGQRALTSLPLPPTFTRGLEAQRLVKLPPCREVTIHLPTSMPSQGFEPSFNASAVSVTNHHTGWALRW
ncbi:hypothetical protein TNCV_1071641 [Trichonephila clavipes]|nr:hypothetical protein TNCV_1071641 [Trichonephila clavipes]